MRINDFYNHNRFMRDVKVGESIMLAQAKTLSRLPAEKTDIQINDIVVSTGSGTYREGLKGKVYDVSLIGKFIRISVDWGSSKTTERLKDVKKEVL